LSKKRLSELQLNIREEVREGEEKKANKMIEFPLLRF